MTQSLYAILNVAPDADPAVIEAAYRALMKKHHPDRMGAAPGAEERAAEINNAFHVLRDPQRRADYDAQERARREQLRPPPPPPEVLARAYHAYQPPPRRRSRLAALLLIILLGVIVYVVWAESTPAVALIDKQPNPRPAATTIKEAVPQAQVAALNEAQVDRAVSEWRRVRARLGLLGLSSYSQDCFAAYRRSGDAGDLDFCVAFDEAAMSGERGVAGTYQPPPIERFQPRVVTARHVEAAGLLSDDPQWVQMRLAQVRALTAERMADYAPAVSSARPAVEMGPVVAEEPSSGTMVQRQRRSRPVSRPARAPRSKRRPNGDNDFLEREGYIY